MELKKMYWMDSGHQLHEINFTQETSVLEVLEKNNAPVFSSCGGNGTCGACRVVYVSGPIGERNELEVEMAEDRSFEMKERLSCQLTPQEGLVVKLI